MAGISIRPADYGEERNVYRQLHRIAALHMRRLAANATLQPTMLVHEAWLRLSGRACRSPTHYVAFASRAMRHFLLDYLRAKNAQKREGVYAHVPLDEGSHAVPCRGLDDVVDIKSLLKRLAAADPRKARVVEMRFFEGLDFAEIARELNISVMTVKRDWQFCRAWLSSELQ